jgi:hypothetical protein
LLELFQAINDKSCRYIGKRGAVSFNLIPQKTSTLIKSLPLPLVAGDPDGVVLFPRSAAAQVEPKLVSPMLLGSDPIRSRTLSKRAAEDNCSFVEATCTANPSCGIMPLYSFDDKPAPLHGEGVFPWQVMFFDLKIHVNCT